MSWIQSHVFAGTALFWWALGLSLLISAVGFWRVVYFVSLGYAGAILGISLLGGGWLWSSLSWSAVLHLGLLGLYGVRLGSYLLPREANPSYKETIRGEYRTGVSLAGRIAIWLSVALLYVLMSAPALYHGVALQQSKAFSQIPVFLGLFVMIAGLGLETLADLQKSAYKKKHPKHYCEQGLYRWVRCPNYLGEMIFWTGNLVAGSAALSALGGVAVWVVSGLGWLSILYIMLYSTARLERKQQERYGDLDEFQQYTRSTPILFPFVPVYSLQKVPLLLRY